VLGREERIGDRSGQTVKETRGRPSGRGAAYDIPAGWSKRTADNNRGLVFQKPGTAGNADMIRIMEPRSQRPAGCVRVYNANGRPISVFGKPGSRSETHISQDYVGAWQGWPE